MRRRRIGVLVAVRALKAETVLVQTDVRVNVDQAGCQHAALAINDAFAVRRFSLAHRGNSAVFEQNPAEKARITLIHRPNVDIFDQCLIHGKPLQKLLTSMVIYGIFIMAVGKAAMHRSYLYPHNPTFSALSQGRARFFYAKAGVALLFQHKLCWARELRSNTPCPGSTFSCTDCLVHTNRAGGSYAPLTRCRKALPTLRAPAYKSKTEVSLGFLLYLRRREPFLRSVAWRTSA